VRADDQPQCLLRRFDRPLLVALAVCGAMARLIDCKINRLPARQPAGFFVSGGIL
jgi:hypothetical protein